MNPQQHREDIQALVDAVNDGADIRLLVVLAAGFIEQNLPTLCLARLGLEGENAEKLFKSHFNRLGGRIDLAVTVGAIDQFVAKAMKDLAEIRNQLVHHPSASSIDHPMIAPIYERLEAHLLSDRSSHVAETGASREAGLRKIIVVLVSQLFDLAERAWGGDQFIKLSQEPS